MLEDFFGNLFDNLNENLQAPKIEPVSEELVQPKWLYQYSTDIMGYEDMRPQPHYELCNLLEWAVDDCKFNHTSQKAAIILLPRDTFKTSISVEALSSAVLTKNPDSRILITSHKARQASQRLSAVRRTFDRNETFMATYGDDWRGEGRSDKWSDSEFTIARRKNVGLREPSVQAAAVGADVTGSHYDLIIADDLVNLDNCYTRESRDRVYDYLVSLFPHLEPGGTLLIVGTRWHEDDAYGRLIKRDETRVGNGEQPRYRKLIRGCYDGPSDLFFPTRLTHEFLDVLKVDMGPRRFAANYLNQTIADEDKTFSMDHLQEVEFDYFRTSTNAVIKTQNGQYPVFTSMAWDTAGSKATSKSDYHGLTVVGTDSLSRWWVCDSIGLKGTPTEIISRVANYVDFYRPNILLIEAVGNYLHWVDALNRKLEPLGISVNIQEVSHGGVPKQERIVMLEIPWNNRTIFMKPGLKTLKEQLDSFSMASLPTHDDEIDSLAMHIGHTQPGEDGHREDFNPLDQEWIRRRRQARVNEATGVWRRGTRYGV